MVIVTAGQAQTVNIPDDVLRNELLSIDVDTYTARDSNGNSIKIDANGNGLIKLAEAQAVWLLWILNETEQAITSIQGLEYFTNLRNLSINDTSITSFDSSLFLQLNSLTIYNNTGITNLDVSGIPSLSYFEWRYCDSLTSVNAANLTELKTIHGEDNPSLTTINLQGSINLENIYLVWDNVSNLNLSGLINVKDIYCIRNNISVLNLEEQVNLKKLVIAGNQLTSLNVSYQQLESLSCFNNEISELTLGVQPYLETISCSDNNLTSLDLSSCTNLNSIDCYDNELHYINNKNGNNTFVFYKDLSSTNEHTFMCVDEGEEKFLLNFFNSRIQFDGIEDIGLIRMSTYCEFDDNLNVITGRLVYDYTNDGCTALDPAIFTPVLLSNEETSAEDILNYTGNYDFFPAPGTYTITPQLDNEWFTINPASATVTILDNDTENIAVQDFCITPNGVHPDIEVTMELQGNWVIPNILGYFVYITNKGNQVHNGIVSITDDSSVLSFSGIEPETPVTEADNLLTWEYNNLQPFETRKYRVLFKGSNDSFQDSIIHYTATITPAEGDETPEDNAFSLTTDLLGTGDSAGVSKVKIYPNPAQSVININPGNEVLHKVELFDLQGRMLQTITPASGNFTLDVSSRDNGIYLLRVYSDKGNTVHKIIKK